MARSAIQLVARSHNAKGKNLKEEIDDLAAQGLISPIMKEWAHEVRVPANEGTHPQPGTKGTTEKDATDVVEFLSFLMTVMYNLPHQIEEYASEKRLSDIRVWPSPPRRRADKACRNLRP